MKQEIKDLSFKILKKLGYFEKVKGFIEFKNRITYHTDFGSIIFDNQSNGNFIITKN